MVFDIKQNLRRKKRFVIGGHVAGPPMAEKYASVFRTENVFWIFLLAQLNDLKLFSRDVVNAYLNVYTKKKMYAISVPEFKEKSGQIMIIEKAMYGLKISSNR